MFGKPKKKTELATPRDDAEAVKVAKAVAEKYPQMSDPNWGKPKKKEAAAKKIAPAKKTGNGLTGENAKQYNSLSADDQAEVDRILGKK